MDEIDSLDILAAYKSSKQNPYETQISDFDIGDGEILEFDDIYLLSRKLDKCKKV